MRSCRPLPVSLDASANLFAGLLALKPFAAAYTPPSIRSNNAPGLLPSARDLSEKGDRDRENRKANARIEYSER